MMWFLFLTILLRNNLVTTDFSPDTTDFDAYGLKIAANDVLFVEADNDAEIFLVQFAPYNYTMTTLQCSIDFDDEAHYVYSVGVGIKQNTTLNPYFYFTGEVVSSDSFDSSGNNGTFIGIWINQDSQTVQDYITMGQTLSCDYFEVDALKFISTYDHQDFFVIAVEPYGQYAIGLATDFAFIYTPTNLTNPIVTYAARAVWPNNATFDPRAADASYTFTVVAGFVEASAGSRTRATPTVYLLSNTNLTVLSTWVYTPTAGTWQARLTYSDALSWNNKYIMSVKINSDDPTRVLIGMPFLNTVFLFVVGNNGASLTLASSKYNGQLIGFGKSVTWLTSSQAAILVTTYSYDYLTWYSSQIYLYTTLSSTNLPASPTAVFPNSQQPIPSTINSDLIRIVSTPESVAILDYVGGVILLLAEPPGEYASTDTTNAPIAASMPVVSYPQTCIAGTYKSDSGVHPCVLCPMGTRNPGGNSGASCTGCASSSFCPLGAVYELDASVLTSLSQAVAYPRSPEIDVFEDLLIDNMFGLGTTSHCIVVSPLFWSLIVLIPIVILLVGMASLNLCVQPAKGDRWRTTIKNIFERTDLVGEGEMWVGGLASIIVVLMTAMAYSFAISFLNQYPSEKVGPSNFACDTTIRNAQFESSLQALAVPISDEEQPIFDLLDGQNFTLRLDFINTAAQCTKFTLSEIIGSSTTQIALLSCNDGNGTLSAIAALPEHDITIEAVIDDIQVVGAVRVGLYGPSSTDDLSELLELNFGKVFYSTFAGTLGQTPSIGLTLTKVVNETESLSSGDSNFGGIWYPTFTYTPVEMFLTDTGYATSADSTSITLTITITETTYYIKNLQSPIAKLPEIMFRTLLFTFLTLEISAMVFLIFKLLIIPLYNKISRLCRKNNKVDPTSTEGELPSHHHH